MQLETLDRRLRLLTLWAVFSTIALIALGVSAFLPQRTPAVLRAERIEVVEGDGRLSMIIANSQRIPGPILDGKELSRDLSSGRIGSAGIIFYTPRGDEVGGLTYRLEETSEGYQASGNLTFDQYRQDQVVGMQYSDNGKSRLAGLRVWDRSPEVPISDLIDLIASARQEGLAGEQGRKELEKARARGDLGAQRVFIGSRDREASVTLLDTKARPRLRLVVDASDNAFLEFLDEAGQIVRRFPN